MNDLKSINLPEILIPVVNKWFCRGDNFYLGPENLWIQDNLSVSFLNDSALPKKPGSWSVCTNNYVNRHDYLLTRQQSREIAAALVEAWKPTKWAFLLDYRCNYSCTMCPFQGDGYNSDYWSSRMKQRVIVNQKTAFKWIDSLAAYGITDLCISSPGEVFLYPHWKKVASYACAKGMTVGTISNGSLITRDICKEMVDNGFSWINISLDAVNRDVYSKVRSGNIEHFNSAMNAPLLCKEFGLKVHVHFVIQKDNISDVDIFIEKWKAAKVDSLSIGAQVNYHKDGTSCSVDSAFFDNSRKSLILPWCCDGAPSFVTMSDGSVAGCCQMQTLLDDNFSYGVVFPKMEDGIVNVVNQIKGLIFSEQSSLHKYCYNCGMYSLRGSACQTQGVWKYAKTGRSLSYVYSPFSVQKSLKKICPAAFKKIIKKFF